MRRFFAVGVVVLAAVVARGAAGGPGGGTITTIAGTGKWGLSGDGGAATRAQLATPHAVAVDGEGNLYIADTNNVRVAKVTSAGTITTIAGTGARQSGYSGDGGPATAALLNDPVGVAVDGQGNVYIAEYLNHRVRKVDRNGTITTIAGTGTAGFSGDGGPATSAQLYNPWGVAVDRQGNVYIADHRNMRVRRVGRNGTITTIAGTGTGQPGFSGDGGPATSARLSFPTGVAVDVHGNVYIADSGNDRVRKVSANGKIATIAGGLDGLTGDSGPAYPSRLAEPAAVAVDQKGDVYIASGPRVRIVSGKTIATFAGKRAFDPHPAGFSGDGGPASSARLNNPRGLAIDGHGNLYIADTDNNRIRKVTKGAAAAPTTKSAPHPKTKTKSPQIGSSQTVKAAVGKLEVDLAQLANGRTKLKNALTGVLSCSVSPQAGRIQLAAVIGNRQRILTRLQALHPPTLQAARIASLLGSAVSHSLAADRHYRAWLGYLQSQPRCSTAHNQDYTAAQREDALATVAKRRFVAAFNPLARQLRLRTWSAGKF